MSGSCSGVQTRIRKIAPQAIYVHCNAHCLNLCLVDCAKAIREASDFFASLETLYVFLSSSKCHSIFMQQQKEIYPDKQPRQLQRLSDTRWACRQGAVNAVCYTFDAIVATLSTVIEGNNGAKSAEARGLLAQVNSFQFVLCLVIFDRILSCTKSLSDVLQSTQLDLARAAGLVSATVETLEEFRSDQEWQKVLVYCEIICKVHKVSTDTTSRPRKLPRHLEENFVLESTGTRDTSAEYKINLYYPVIDAFLSELRDRFTDKNKSIMQALQACNPTCSHFLDPAHLEPLINTYGLDQYALELELPLAKRTVARKDLQDISDAIL